MERGGSEVERRVKVKPQAWYITLVYFNYSIKVSVEIWGED